MQKAYKQQDLYGNMVTVDLRIDNVPKGIDVSAEMVDETVDGAIERLITTLSSDSFRSTRSENERTAMKIAKPGGHEEDDLMIMAIRAEVVFNDHVDPLVASLVIGKFTNDLIELLVGCVREVKTDAREPITQQLELVLTSVFY